MTTKTIDGITYQTLDRTEDETLTLASFDLDGERWNIVVIANEFGDVLTLSDWQQYEQPKTIAESFDYDWVYADEWYLYDPSVSDICESIIHALKMYGKNEI